ncbi:MAG: ABC transporter ATP-binding protein, partial [Candidatus Dormibacteria bacterium]
RLARRADGEASSVAQEVLSSLAVVQAFGAEELEAARYAEATGRGLAANRRAIVAQSELTPLTTVAMTASMVLVLFVGAQAVILHQLTPGDLLVFMAYLRGMYSPMRQLAKLAGVIGRAQAAGERVLEILDTHEEMPEPASPRRLGRARGAISLQGVGYAYPSGRTVLAGIDLEVPAGTHQALVGVTGSGKSTLLRLIPRFTDPTSGSVRLDGVDVRRLTLGDLRRQIAYVPQESHLFRATVWENIMYARGPEGRGSAKTAARAAGVHDVIASLRDGYDTVVGERGQTLSGGQRQCVAVARAMARNAPILLLDEPTVGLDAELEGVLVAALGRLTDGRTTITVSHQMSSLRHSDRIAVLADGRISEAGTHQQLLLAGNLYSGLHGRQREAALRVSAGPAVGPGSPCLRPLGESA